jgi:NADH:ubiquinone oxidoreductase subunit 4 (subunit M)
VFHIWLPRAHVESPLSGSVLLAGILLKLGSYGLLRYCIVLLPVGTYYFSPIVFLLCVTGIVYSSVSTIRQIDLKRVIAYSSIGHMAISTLGLFVFNIEAMEGSWYLMIAHGVTSPGLFICVTLIY